MPNNPTPPAAVQPRLVGSTSGSANLEDLLARCKKLHSFIGWYCMSCDSEVDATYRERCASCGGVLHDETITGNLVEAATYELNALKCPWHPIETAPKDDRIDIWLSCGTRWCDCYYDVICDQWRTSRPSGNLLSVKARFVSHWMPIPQSPKPANDAPRQKRLVRLDRSNYLDFDPPQRCECGGSLQVKDYPNRRDESRYEVFCPQCSQCDPNGYGSQREVIDQFPSILSENSGSKFYADDRGNVVDYYDETEQVARIDREATVNGKADQSTFDNWAGGQALEAWMRLNDYGEELDEAARI